MKEELERALSELRDSQEAAQSEYDLEVQAFWDSMSKEDQLKCFYAVCKRIHKGELEDKGTYRYVLYDVFGFGPDAYAIGMMSGYLNIHNAIEHEVEK